MLTTYDGLSPGDVVIANALVQVHIASGGSANILEAECLWLLGGVKCRGDNQTYMLGQGVGANGELLNSAGFAGDEDNVYGVDPRETLAACPF